MALVGTAVGLRYFARVRTLTQQQQQQQQQQTDGAVVTEAALIREA
ncbi:hypothetical protein [Streptomyces hypolithicus]